jgi:hypothetical protein
MARPRHGSIPIHGFVRSSTLEQKPQADTIRELDDALKEEYPAAVMDTAEISAQMQMETLAQDQK